MNSLYRNAIIERIRYAIAAARAVGQLEHAGTKGAVREVLIGELFRPLLSADLGIATGVVISADNLQSSQQDIILFNRRILPPVLFQHGPALVPIECALACIEIKSRLTSQELRNAQEGSDSLTALQMFSGTKDERGQFVDVRGRRPISMLLALETDLTVGTEADRYNSVLDGRVPTLAGISVVGRSFTGPTEEAVYDYSIRQWIRPDGSQWVSRRSQFVTQPSDGNYSEVLTVLTALHERVDALAASRGLPPLRVYLR